MFVVPPLTIYGTALLTSSDISEPDVTQGEAVWSSGTTYAAADEVIETTNHRKYQSLQAGNLNHALPNYAVGETENSWWVDIGPTNKWAMFDFLRNTASVKATSINVVVSPGQRIDTVALLGLVGQSVTISVTSGGATVYGPTTTQIRQRDIADWYDYFFAPFTSIPSVIFSDLPTYSDMIISLTISNPGGDAYCGAVVLGTQVGIGDIEYNPVSEAVNYSVVERDDFGNATLIPRRSIPKTTQKVYADAALIDIIRQLRSDLNAEVAVWCGMDDSTHVYAETLLIIGFYRSWTIDMTTPDVIEQDIEIEEI